MNFCTIWPTSWLTLEGFWKPVGEHLWQTTLFVAVVALLTVLLKKNRAQVRYTLWLIASLKFLNPFSLLVAAGNYFSRLQAPGIESPEILFLIRGPFGAGAAADMASTNDLTLASRFAPAILLMVWAIGAAAVMVFWWLRWRRTMALVRTAAPLTEGRELDTLRRLEKTTGMKKGMDLVTAAIPLEPGIVGLFRPVLFLPAGMSERLTEKELQAILSHELCHVKRRDNLAATVHLLVEALFWFHPLAWWIGARMMEERERACDEEVLAQGSDPRTYAESILKICELRLATPPSLMAGVTGAELKERIEAIMNKRAALQLDVKRRALLAAIGLAAVFGPVAVGALSPRAGMFESKARSTLQSATKYVLGEIKIEGDVHDRQGIQDRILKAWKGREYDDAKQLAESVMHEGVRLEFQNRGYFKAVASDPVSQPLGTSGGKQSVRVVTTIQEGAQYRVGTVGFQNAEADKALSISSETLREQMQLRTGDLVNISAAHSGIERIQKLYSAKNSSAEVTPEIAIDDQRHMIDVVFRVKETPNAN
jgi:beta-lactamase regulating signal transducer with metallopeptidase domain